MADHRRGGACLGARRWPQPVAATTPAMSAAALQGLADLLPLLLCGEESAEHVFTLSADRLPASMNAGMRGELARIAADEHQHGLLLLDLRQLLPPPAQSDVVRRAVRFLKSLASSDLKLHLARIAALDAGVCGVLTAIGAPGTPIAATPAIAEVFRQIRQDESGHVRISRRCARLLGLDAQTEALERRRTQSRFADLLAPSQPAFAALGVDLPPLLRRLRGEAPARS